MAKVPRGKSQSREAKRVRDSEKKPRENGYSDEFYTPARYYEPLGPFGLDPAAGPKRIASVNFNIKDGQCGLSLPWKGLGIVWMNPPYSNKEAWLENLARHDGGGFALVTNDTESIWWQRAANQCSAFLLIKGRIPFESGDGRKMPGNTKGSTIFAYGEEAVKRLKKAVSDGRLKGIPSWSK
jgi:hypothetical protein